MKKRNWVRELALQDSSQFVLKRLKFKHGCCILIEDLVKDFLDFVHIEGGKYDYANEQIFPKSILLQLIYAALRENRNEIVGNVPEKADLGPIYKKGIGLKAFMMEQGHLPWVLTNFDWLPQELAEHRRDASLLLSKYVWDGPKDKRQNIHLSNEFGYSELRKPETRDAITAREINANHLKEGCIDNSAIAYKVLVGNIENAGIRNRQIKYHKEDQQCFEEIRRELKELRQEIQDLKNKKD